MYVPLCWTGTHQDSRNDLNEAFNVNVTGAHRVTRAFLPLLRQGQRKMVTNM